MYQKKDYKLFIISGKAKSGKDEVANQIKKYYSDKKCIQIAFAYYLKDYLKRMNMYDEGNKDQYRSTLQEFGIDFLGKQIDSNFLIHRVLEDIEVFSYFYDVIIITDARLQQEIEKVKEKYPSAITIRIESVGENNLSSNQKMHITETGLDSYQKFDYIIQNDSDISSLQGKISEVLKEV